MRFVGIDPGILGGVAVIDEHDTEMLVTSKTPIAERDVFELLRNVLQGWSHDQWIVVERVGGYVGGGPTCPTCRQQRNRSPGSSMFVFGRGAGFIAGCLTALGKNFVEVDPQKWQAALGMRKPRGMSQQDWKRRLKKYAQEAYPHVKVTLWAADAILLARYAMLTYGWVATDLFEDAHAEDR